MPDPPNQKPKFHTLQTLGGLLSACFAIGLLAACQADPPSPPPEPPGEKRLAVVGWGYAPVASGATPRQRLMSRQRALRLAKANLAAQMAGKQFTYEIKNTPSTTITQLTLATQAHIQQPQAVYCDVGDSGILVKLSAEVVLPQADIQRAFRCHADLQTENVMAAEAALFRQAIERAIDSQKPNLNEISGTVYLTDFSISADNRKAGVKLGATLLVLFDPTPS